MLGSKGDQMAKALRFCAMMVSLALHTSLPAAEAPDLSGRWLPVAVLSTPWPNPLPLTDAARQRLAAFNADRDEPAGFCMPLGTPRNTLSGTSPLEVLQTADRVYFIFQPDLLNTETRRVYLDGRAFPTLEEQPPTWLGTSRGHWEGKSLVVETAGLEPQALLSGNGLSHGPRFRLTERWHLGNDPRRGRVLVDDLLLVDADAFTTPIKLRRVFAWAPDALLEDGQCSERLWIDALWRHRLGEHAAAARAGKPKPTPEQSQGTPEANP
jgi:hypothetical protein